MTMVKSRTARLSLTMPGPVRASGEFVRPPTTDGSSRSSPPRSSRREKELSAERNRKESIGQGEEEAFNRSISPSQLSKSAPPHNANSPQSPTSPKSPTFTSLPPFPPSEGQPKHARDPSKSFFANLKASKSSIKIQPPDTIRKVSQDTTAEDDMRHPFRIKSTPDLRGGQAAEPVPDLPALDSRTNTTNNTPAATNPEHSIPRRPVGLVSSPNVMSPETEQKRNPGLFANLIKKNHSNRHETSGNSSKPSTPTVTTAPELPSPRFPSRDGSQPRNRSQPRNGSDLRNSSPHSESGDISSGRSTSNPRPQVPAKSQSFRDGSGTNFLHGIKNNAARAAEGIGKAGNRFFKGNKSPPSIPGPTKAGESAQFYQCTVINLPLVEQTRITRIAKRLEHSKDKTEFWMPSLPWRCIDYLNYKGCEVEGLYRIPGSEREIKLWKQRFDLELDVNLFDEEDLYDVNTIGSLFKAWLRELPDEIFPKITQDNITTECSASQEAPQALKDALSRLPPWNYYLLFAITCHLSLLHAYADKNKMGYQNLVICFAPALKMNGDCFRWLVTDWRNCWQGCWTEKEALEEEYQILDNSEGNADEPTDASDAEADRSLSSAGSGGRLMEKKPAPLTLVQHQHYDNDYDGRMNLSPTANQTGGKLSLTPNANPNGSTSLHSRNLSQLPELSLPKPISPIFTSDHGH